MTGQFLRGSEKKIEITRLVAGSPVIEPAIREAYTSAAPADLGSLCFIYAEKVVSKSLSVAEIVSDKIGSDPYDIYEIGCGLALPSLALASMGIDARINAMDINMNYLPFWVDLQFIARPERFNYSINTFYAWKQDWTPAAGRKIMLLADQPRSMDNDASLERNIVKFAVRNRRDIALVPFPSELGNECERTRGYMETLSQAGYSASCYDVQGIMQQRLIIGMA